jgi:hypothetical protein
MSNTGFPADFIWGGKCEKGENIKEKGRKGKKKN